MTTDDAQALLSAVDPTFAATGKALAFVGTVDLSRPGLPLDGRLDVEGLRITRAPWLARVVGLASLSGIAFVRNSGWE